MRRYTPAIALLLLLGCSHLSATPSNMSEQWLKRLDEAVERREQINEQKHAKLTEMRMAGSRLASIEDVYWHNSQIYDECFTFDSELAMEVADANLTIARQQENLEQEQEWSIKKAFILASTGQLLEAATNLSDIRSEGMSHAMLLLYYDQMQYLYQHLAQYSWNVPLKEEYTHQADHYNDSIFQILQPEDPDFLWYHSWSVMFRNADEAIQILKPVVDTLSLTSRNDAKLAYALARAYDLKQDRDNYLQYMAQSGIADLQAANQDIASLEELAAVLYEEGDLHRAYAYINVCLASAHIYNNLVRTISIIPVMDQIVQSYQERDAQQRRNLIILVIVLTLALILVVGFALLSRRQRRRLSVQRTKLRETNILLNKNQVALAEVNTSLQAANRQLQEAMQQQAEVNQQLQEANYVKEEYIGYVFSLCSSYIGKMDDYRKNINRKAKVKQFDDILTLTNNTSLVQDELKEFYHNFDALFLNVYPHFIDDFNALLNPEERIEPKKGELLNTDLRIYALVRLGIADSVKIAEFLHISPQTVYNNRLKIRNKAIVPKDDFTQHVRKLGFQSHD